MPVRRRAVLAGAAFPLLGMLAGAAYAAFAAMTSNPASSITAAPDWTAPTASASVVARSSGCTPTTPGYVKQGSSYYAYAAVSDTGNPASGVSTVTANVSAVTAAQTAAALSSGSFSVGGVSYTRRTAAITADAIVTPGTKTYSLTLADNAGNSATQSGFSVTVDNTPPVASDVQPTNGAGGTAGRAEAGDVLTLTVSEPLEPCSVLAGWDGSSTTVTVRIANSGSSDDTVTVWNAGNTTQLPLGSVDLNGDLVSANTVFSSSTMVVTGNNLVITLGTMTSGSVRTDNKTTPVVWTPSTTPYDRAANTMLATVATESGALDISF